MISLPILEKNNYFKWQLDLFWYNHLRCYGSSAKQKCLALVVSNFGVDSLFDWDIDIPYKILKPYNRILEVSNLESKPLNIQSSILQIIDSFDDDQILEIIDCDMFHFRRHPEIKFSDDEIFVDVSYEDWHLKSLSDNKGVIDIYFENGGSYYNGGFVPIIGKVKTIKKILREWILVHIDIVKRYGKSDISWWAGMYALQAACEKVKVNMVGKDYCYIPRFHSKVQDDNYIAHYSVDNIFNKKDFPNTLNNTFPKNEFYDRIEDWRSDGKVGYNF